MSEDDELEELRRRRALELQKNLAQDQQQSDAEKRLEAQKQVLMRRILTQEAQAETHKP